MVRLLPSTLLNQTNQRTPYGNLDYDQTGTYNHVDPLTGKVHNIPRFTATQTLAPPQQRFVDQGFRAQNVLVDSLLQGLFNNPIEGNYGGYSYNPSAPQAAGRRTAKSWVRALGSRGGGYARTFRPATGRRRSSDELSVALCSFSASARSVYCGRGAGPARLSNGHNRRANSIGFGRRDSGFDAPGQGDFGANFDHLGAGSLMDMVDGITGGMPLSAAHNSGVSEFGGLAATGKRPDQAGALILAT